MANPALTDAELQEIKQRLGYPSMLRTALPYMQTALVFEDVVKNNVDDYGIGWIRNTILPQLRLIDVALGGDDLAFDKVVEVVGEVKLDMEQKLQLTKARRSYWLRELSTTVNVAIHGGAPGEVVLQ